MLKHLAGHAFTIVALALPCLALADTPAPAIHIAAVDQAACTSSDSDARVIYAAPAEMPPIAAVRDVHGTAVVRVDLLPSGDIGSATIATSSGDPYLDKAALDATRASRFQAPLRNCAPVAGSFLFEVGFGR